MRLIFLATGLLLLITLANGCANADNSIADALNEHEWTVISMDGFTDERSVGLGIFRFLEDDAGQPFVRISNSCGVGGASAFEWTADGLMLVPDAEDAEVNYGVDDAACEPSDGLLSLLISDGESYTAELLNNGRQVMLIHPRYKLTLER